MNAVERLRSAIRKFVVKTNTIPDVALMTPAMLEILRRLCYHDIRSIAPLGYPQVSEAPPTFEGLRIYPVYELSEDFVLLASEAAFDIDNKEEI